ncbi:hypothetical protein QSH57_014404 [Fusarium oxysporum f. sp. vasinfectum]|nr:hypothetical protein QSH57_014404 [Fusarium oxysporum f. sp. vasinfectum]
MLAPVGDPVTNPTKGEAQNKRIQGDYHEIAGIGDDLGPSHYIPGINESRANPGFGTLGCLLQIKLNGESKWRTCALTNYHVVRPAFDGFSLESPNQGVTKMASQPQGSDLWNIDFGGYNLSTKLIHKLPSFESPSRSKHNFTITVIDEDIDAEQKNVAKMEKGFRTTKNKQQVRKIIRDTKAMIADMETEKQKKIAFFDQNKQVLGKLIACSGLQRSVQDRKMDLGINRGRSIPTMVQYSPRTPYEVGQLFKVGAITGARTGKYEWKKQTVAMDYDCNLANARLWTTEIVFGPRDDIGSASKLCDHGDSGSVMFNQEGEILALMFRGHKHQDSYDGGYGYATPIEHIFRDIKEFSNVVNIRVAE